eukprot:m.40910 g.40910  ORF g.40910 m.40910 type:complete len:98 (-) comp10388_c0_seq1:65-358(-)
MVWLCIFMCVCVSHGFFFGLSFSLLLLCRYFKLMHCLQLEKLTEESASTFIKYITQNAPPGIATRVILRSVEAMPGLFRDDNKNETDSAGGKEAETK